MTTISKFSDISGENVQLSQQNSTASWTPKSSGGQAYCESELLPGQTVTVRVEGSGRCDVGFLKGDPDSSVPATFKTLNEIRAHRRACDIPITFDSNGEEVSSSFQGKKFKKNVEKGEKIRIAVNLQYGLMQIEMLSNGSSNISLKFKSQGANVQLENNDTRVSSICKNPASICIIAEKLVAGQTLRFACSPINEGGRQPGRYGFELLVSEKDPNSLRSSHGYLFAASKPRDESSGLIKIESFEKEDCNGPFQVKLSEDSTIQYTGPTGKKNEQRVAIPTSQGVWIVLDLYRVRICTMGDLATEAYDDVDSWRSTGNSVPAEDVPDSFPLQPRPGRMLTVVQPEVSPQTSENEILTRLEYLEHAIQTITGKIPDPNSTGRELIRRLESVERGMDRLAGKQEFVRPLTNIEETSVTALPVHIVDDAEFKRRLEIVEQAFVGNRNLPSNQNSESTNTGMNASEDKINVKKHFATLVMELQTKEFCDHLYEKDILTEAQMERIQLTANSDRPQANRELLKLLRQNGHKVRKSDMQDILSACNQIHLIEKFYP